MVVFLRPTSGHDVAGEDRVRVLAVVGVHLQDAADPLLAVLGRVEDRVALLERARVDPDVGQLAEWGSVMILKARAENGSLSSALRSELLDRP